MRNWRSFSALLAAGLSVQGCSLAPVIRAQSLDYNTVVEDVTNQSIVTNVLRGRDRAPLYFPDLSQIRGAVTATASAQATIPYGPTFGTVQSGPLSISTAPTFDIAPTNTKQFYQGILNPVSKDRFAYFLERDRAAADFEPTFNMLVDAIEILQGPRSRVVSWTDDDFVTLSSLWFESASPRVVQLRDEASTLLGPPVKADAKSIMDAETAGFVLKAHGAMIQLSRKPRTTVCFSDGAGYFPVEFEDNSVVKAPAGDDLAGREAAPLKSACSGLAGGASGLRSSLPPSLHRTASTRYRLHLRSVEKIFYYLGEIVRDEAGRFAIHEGRFAGCPRIAFYIHRRPDVKVRFSVPYRGETYYVAEDAQPTNCGTGRNYERTLPLLEVVNDLLNLNRDASEVPTTKAVQAVGPT